MNPLRPLATSIAVLIIAGCAHPITVAPDLTTLEQAPASRITRSVAYFIPPTAMATEVTTAGGGGDNVRYFPYREIDAGFHRILLNVFGNVVKLSSMSEASGGKSTGIDYVLSPEMITTSGGSGMFTWPPTSFTVDLTSSVRDAAGKLLTTVRVVGAGTAETGERIREHGIAGRRAMEDALLKMQAALLESKVFSEKPELGSPSAKSNQLTNGSASSRLDEIKALKDSGKITQEEYDAKRKSILDSL